MVDQLHILEQNVISQGPWSNTACHITAISAYIYSF